MVETHGVRHTGAGGVVTAMAMVAVAWRIR